MAKKKKEKVIYYDDNSTIADMSNVGGIGRKPRNKTNSAKSRSTFRERWHTYWSAVKMMLIPTCIALIVLSSVFLVFYFLAR
jgi:hypothetical protein